MIKDYLHKEVPTPIAIGVILVLVVLVGGYTWWQYEEMWAEGANIPEVKAPEIGAKDCVSDEFCVVFGEDGDCNCGCFNKNHNWEAEGACFCAAPASCECVEGKCEGIFGEDNVADWETYINEEHGFEVRHPKDWIVKENVGINFGEEKEVEEAKIFKIGFTVNHYQDKSELWGNEEESLSLDDWVSKTFEPLQEGESIKNIIFGEDDYKGVSVEKYKAVGVIAIVPYIFTQRGESIYEIIGEVPTLPTSLVPTDYDYYEVFNQILSTFRFLN